MWLSTVACREDDGLFLESDTDEQLLLNIHFNQKVRIHSITIKGPEEEGPKVVKLYTNRCAAVGTRQQARTSAAGWQAKQQACSCVMNSCKGWMLSHDKGFHCSVTYMLAVHVVAARS
jgi:hypothetical protein